MCVWGGGGGCNDSLSLGTDLETTPNWKLHTTSFSGQIYSLFLKHMPKDSPFKSSLSDWIICIFYFKNLIAFLEPSGLLTGRGGGGGRGDS